MGLFDHVKKFRLFILNEEFYDERIQHRGPLGGIFEHHVLMPTEPLDIELILKNKLLAGDWISFKEWYIHNEHHLLYRGLEGYTMTGLRYLIKYGNDRRDRNVDDPMSGKDMVIYKQYGLRPQDFIWAVSRLHEAWGYAKPQQSKNILILAYDRRLLKEIAQDAVYTLNDGVKSFRQALSATILIYKKF